MMKTFHQKSSHIKGTYLFYYVLELQWHQAPPSSSWDTGRVAPFLFFHGGIYLIWVIVSR